MADIIFGLDIGTTKICAVVGEVREGQLQIIGLGITPSRGMRKGMVIDVGEASLALATAVEQAEQTSGYDLSQALVSMAGEHISSTNNNGIVPINRNSHGVTAVDIEKALDIAQAIPLPHNRQIVHIIPRGFKIDDQDGVRSPLGMHGFRLEVEAHIVTADRPALQNLSQCTHNVGIHSTEFVLNALASGEAVLEPNERDMGVIVADIGGGTTDIALYAQGKAWYTRVYPVGGYHITNDIAIGLRAPYDVAEQVKIQFGDCRPDKIDPEHVFTVEPFGGEKIQVGRQDLAHVIEARVEEIFQLVLQDLKRCGYEGLLPAGIVLTGGTAQLRGIADIAERVLNVPARVAQPRNLTGMIDKLHSPAYATSVGLLRWAMSDNHLYQPRGQQREWGRRVGSLLKTLLPG
ncbi:MAG: cell division protein FtsA [Chloroflexi bacterium]|nr:cell division protein FtsA [Ardenticatenaceae bacterium]MBL1129457.1 cell division protein FtsA [Chloroflexota bacterium]NOG35537.1 cell division protein FtsA [Chloroflexota bacterium]GIK55708.1 MAG: cell division protein FtsA [Chloroflexota bacterium]